MRRVNDGADLPEKGQRRRRRTQADADPVADDPVEPEAQERAPQGEIESADRLLKCRVIPLTTASSKAWRRCSSPTTDTVVLAQSRIGPGSRGSGIGGCGSRIQIRRQCSKGTITQNHTQSRWQRSISPSFPTKPCRLAVSPGNNFSAASRSTSSRARLAEAKATSRIVSNRSGCSTMSPCTRSQMNSHLMVRTRTHTNRHHLSRPCFSRISRKPLSSLASIAASRRSSSPRWAASSANRSVASRTSDTLKTTMGISRHIQKQTR